MHIKILTISLILAACCAATAWADAPQRTPAVSPYGDARVLSDYSVGAGAAPTGDPSRGITIGVYASSAPNAYGSPSWSGYMVRALNALENNLSVHGDRSTDPTGYEHAPAQVPGGEIAVTSFNSWRGVVEPAAPFDNESGNRMHFGLHAVGDGTTQFELDDLTFELHSSDPNDTLVFVGDFIGYSYNGTSRYGIDWVDGIKGNGDDIVYTSGNGTTPVDEIVYVGVGNAWWPAGGDPDPSNPIAGKQGAMDDYFAWLVSVGPIDVTCNYSIGSDTGSDTVTIVPPQEVSIYPSLVPDEEEPRVNLGDAPATFEPDSWQNSATGKVNWHARYLADGDFLTALFPDQAATLTINDLESIRYSTKRPTGTTAGQDWAVFIYTRPITGGDSSWYGYRFVNNFDAHTETDAWTQYSTASGMTFRKNSGTPTGHMSLDDLKTAYGTELVEMISVMTMSDWSGVFNGYMDGLIVTLTDGTVGRVNFVGGALTLEPDFDCYMEDETVTVELWMRDITENISGGQFFLEYDDDVLSLDTATAESPFIQLYLDTSVSGLIDYSVFIMQPDSVTGDQHMATITFIAEQQICTEPDLVTFRPHDPPTRLSDDQLPSNSVYPALVDMDVIDNVAPTITCPDDFAVECAENVPAAYADLAAFETAGGSADDNCDDDLTFSLTSDTGYVGDSCSGTVTRVYRVTDYCGNYAECTQVITVDDTTNPTITCPVGFAVECEENVPAAYADLAAFLAAGGTANDNCDTALTFSLTSDTGYVGDSCSGTVTRVYRVTDDCDNYDECTQVITVQDTTDPVITCPDDIVVNADAGGCDAVVNVGQKCFGDYTFNPDFEAYHFDDVFDLTQTDLTLTYTIDLSQVTQVETWDTPYVEVGLREVGAADFNPGPYDTYQGGAGGWMTSLVGDLATDPDNLDLDDKHNLSASGGRGECDYDVYASAPSVVVVPPFGSFNTQYIWFDRDGVDPYQDTKGANSGGTYDITIRYHAIDAGLGSMIATINGNGIDTVNQEFLVGGTYYPGGLSFTGDMTQMQLFYGAWYTDGAGGPVTVSDMCLTASARATDNCDTDPTITAVRSDSQPLTDPYPQGTTTITWEAEDDCGNTATCTQTVTVLAYNDLVVDVELSATMYDPNPGAPGDTLTRCITFELWECGGPSSQIVTQDITFCVDAGLPHVGSATFDVPCGLYTCITARDTLHTLRSTVALGTSGTQYTGDFTGARADEPSPGTGHRLVGGNLNDDFWIDILDFGTFSAQWGTVLPADTPCSYSPPSGVHADINGSGLVDLADFTFIQINFLQGHEANCCGQPLLGDGDDGPITEISVDELYQLGLGHLAVADLNNDGWLDEADIVAFMNGARPKPDLVPADDVWQSHLKPAAPAEAEPRP